MRTFTNISNYLEVNHTFALAPVGCIVFYFRPNWTGYSGTGPYNLFQFSNVAGDALHFHKLQPINDGGALPWPESIWAGIVQNPTPAPNVDWRVLIDSQVGFSEPSKLFRAAEGAWWQYTWDAPNGCSWLFKNAANVGGLAGRPGFHVPFTVPVFTNLKIGTDGPHMANGDIGEFAIFDYHLSDEQREDMLLTGIAGVSPAPTFWIKILGTASPEPAEIGPAMTVVGSPPQAAFPHPTFRAVPPQITAGMKPLVGSPISPAHPLTDGLIWAMPFNEGSGLPKEHVSGITPTLNTSVPPGPHFVWEADGSLHLPVSVVDALRWDGTTVFDGLTSFTICLNMKIDLYVSASGPLFAFPNTNNPAMFGKQYCMGFSQGDLSQSVFAFSLNHDDEAEANNGNHGVGQHLGKGSGGRWGFWTWSGRGTGPPQTTGFPSFEGIDTWYVWRGTWLPWQTRFRQMFFIYDITAPPSERWTCRINGRREYPADVLLDSPQPLEVTAAPVVFGATNVAPFPLSGQMLGSFQYLYVWNEAKPDAWQTLLDNPYAMFGSVPSGGEVNNMATYQKFHSFVEAVAEKKHNLGADVLKVMFTLTAPLVTNTVKADLTEIAAGNGYTAGGVVVTTASSSQTGGIYKLVLNDAVVTASGGNIGPFQYAALYNDTATNKELIGFWNYSTPVTIANGEFFTVDLSPTTGVLTLS